MGASDVTEMSQQLLGAPLLRVGRNGLDCAHHGPSDGPQEHLEHLGTVPPRGPGGAIGSIRLALWSPILLRGVAGALLLGLVAYLGHRSRDIALYGEPVTLVVDNTNGVPSPPTIVAQAATSSSLHSPSPAHGSAPCPRSETSPPASAGRTRDGKVILNEATAAELVALPGVGPARAQAILELRNRLGKFKKATDLLRVRGIGLRTLQKMTQHFELDRPEPEGVEQGGDVPPSVKPSSQPPPSGPSRSPPHGSPPTAPGHAPQPDSAHPPPSDLEAPRHPVTQPTSRAVARLISATTVPDEH